MKTFFCKSTSGPRPVPPEGFSLWIEKGEFFIALKIDPTQFGPHKYFMGECIYHCGCRMFSSSSSGNVDPFGACPNNLL